MKQKLNRAPIKMLELVVKIPADSAADYRRKIRKHINEQIKGCESGSGCGSYIR